MSDNNIMEGIKLSSQAADKVRSALKIENRKNISLVQNFIKISNYLT